MPESILIVYSGGAYGTYLEWVLTTLLTNAPVVLPFNSNGNSHRFIGNQISISATGGLKSAANDNVPVRIARAHPKTLQTDSIKDNVLNALNSFDRILFCYPEHNSVLLAINNSFDKIWQDRFDRYLNDPTFASNLYTNWPVTIGTPSDLIPFWIKREILSFYMMPSWHDEVEWFLPSTFQHPSCKFIYINDLLHRFEECVISIQKFCNLSFKKEISSLIPFHNLNMSLQKHRSQDEICNQIVNSIIGMTQLRWGTLPLPSEAWIQWQLRNLGYELKCNNLNVFPTATDALQDLLYRV